jgi:hypothetical protein
MSHPRAAFRSAAVHIPCSHRNLLFARAAMMDLGIAIGVSIALPGLAKAKGQAETRAQLVDANASTST